MGIQHQHVECAIVLGTNVNQPWGESWIFFRVKV